MITSSMNNTENSESESIEVVNKPSIRNGKLRWLMLIFGCMFLMGSYYCYDIPASCATYFGDAPYGYGAGKINLMYQIYSFPNIVLPLLGGILIDKIGVKISLMLFTILLTLG